MSADSGNESPSVYVLSCRGGAQGELGVVRSLGRRGIRVVLVAEYESRTRLSKYCDQCHVNPGLFDQDGAGVAYLNKLAEREVSRPILFPTADPDLTFVSRNREALAERFRLFVSASQLIENLIDKGKFFAFAQEHDLPTPKTSSLSRDSNIGELAAAYQFPVILKPLIPQSWGKPEIVSILGNRKALLIGSLAELQTMHRTISEVDDRLALQEYVPGRDDRLYSLHAYISQQGEVVGSFVGQKVRTYPPYAGIGCYVRSIDEPALRELGLKVLRSISYTGLALAQFKQHEKTGQFYLLEINPRLSSWNGFATACGIDLPYAVYCDAVGLPLPKFPPQRTGRNYLYFEHDISAMREYVRKGDLTFLQWLASVCRRNEYQYLALDDIRPFLDAGGRWLGGQLRKLVR